MQKYRVEINEHGTVRWFEFDTKKLHRLDGPAIEWVDGAKSWYQNGQCHRLDGPATECANGTKSWWQNDQRHRLDGPAIEWPDGAKEWWQNGQRHRLDGPAIESANGDKEWWIEGKNLSEAEFLNRTKLAESCDGREVVIDGKTYQLKLKQ